jgi:hypothetical protein
MNIMATDTIIFSKSDFNPQNYLQGVARAHQIGRTSENHFLSSLACLGWGPGDSTKQGVERPRGLVPALLLTPGVVLGGSHY